MKKILLRLMDYGLKGVDTYTYNGSVWLIFTDTKQWVLELTSEKTLWYNYTFFKQLFCVATSDVTTQDKFITEWAEKNMIKPFYSTPGGHTDIQTINDVIDNGVKETHHVDVMKFFDNKMDDTIQNGVRHTEIGWHQCNNIDDTIAKGIKETNYDTSQHSEDVGEVIQHGIKEIYEVDWDVPNDIIDEVIDDGVIEIRDWNESIKGDLTRCVNNVIENGVKETKVCNYVDPKTQLMWVKWGNQIDEVIEEGEKISGTFVGGKLQKSKTDTVINYGVKETEPMDDWVNTNRIVTEVIDNGIKETKTPGDDGDILGVMDWMEENKTNSIPKMIDDIIENGVKETLFANRYDYIGPIFKEGKIQEVIEKGIKNPTD